MSNNIAEYLDTYQRYVYQEAFDDQMLLLSIKEICGETETFSSLNESTISIQEGKFDNLTEFISRVCTAIANAVSNFLAKVTEITGIDKKYLNDHKDILSKPIKEGVTFKNWYDYNIEKMENYKVPGFDKDEVMQNLDKYTSKEDFIKNYPGLDSGIENNADVSLIDRLKSTFRGDVIAEKKSDEFKNSDLVAFNNYVQNKFPNMKQKLTDDLSKIKQFNITVSALIKSMASNSPAALQNSPEMNAESTIEYYFKEDGETTTMEKDEPKENEDTTQKDDKVEAKNDISKAAKYYVQVASDILSTKMNIAHEAYKIYMKFLRWHIDQYIKQDKEEKKNTNKNVVKTDSKNPVDMNDILDNAVK